jgi:hypothetical protein
MARPSDSNDPGLLQLLKLQHARPSPRAPSLFILVSFNLRFLSSARSRCVSFNRTTRQSRFTDFNTNRSYYGLRC